MKNPKNSEKTTKIAYHETKRHADTMFAFNIYPCTIPLDFSFVPLHWQDSVEIIYIKKGNGEVRVDMESYRAQQGDIFIVLPGHIHGISSMSKSRMEYENMIFDLDFLGINQIDICSRKYLRPLLDGEITLPVYIGPENELYKAFMTCMDQIDLLCDKKGKGYEVGVKGLLLFTLQMLLDGSSEVVRYEANLKSDQKIKHVLTKIETDYGKSLTVEAMAKECGYSSSHFMRWFKENTGFGFNRYLIEYRLNRAADALRNSNDTIINIASNTGFENLSNFNRLFKKRFLMTPTEFRKEM